MASLSSLDRVTIPLVFVLILSISEFSLLLFRRSGSSGKARSSTDRYSLVLFWILIPVCLNAGFWILAYQRHNLGRLAVYAAIIFYVCGLLIRWTAIYQLGKEFTVDVALSKNHSLKTDGLYRLVRHPSYSGLMLMFLGISLSFLNSLAFVIILFPVFLAVLYRINVEEKALLGLFGEQYARYMARTNRLIPYCL